MSLAPVQHTIDNQLYAQLDIPASAVPLVETPWPLTLKDLNNLEVNLADQIHGDTSYG